MSTEKTSLLRENKDCNNQGCQDTDENEALSEAKKTPLSVKVTFVCMALTDFMVGWYFSLVVPFFPTMAQQKSIGPVLTGFVFSCFEMVILMTTPIWGKLIVQTGPRFMYTTGVITCACCSVLFGVLQYCPSGTMFGVMSCLTRSVEGAGAAAYSTASYTIIGILFPERTGTTFGLLESSMSIGFIVGPLVGGGLYQTVGYMLTFVVSAVLLLGIGLVGVAAMKVNHGETQPNAPMCRFLCRPLVAILLWQVVVVAGVMYGFIDVTLSLHLKEQFNLTPLAVGAVFLTTSATYTLSSPTVGHFGDKYCFLARPLLMSGVILSGLVFLLVGPAPFFFLPRKQLWLLVLCLALFGVVSGVTALTFGLLGQAASEAGYPDDLATNGMVAAAFGTAQSLGFCLGPPIGGFMYDSIGFSWGATAVGFLALLSAIPLAVYSCLTKSNSKSQEGYNPLPGNDSEGNPRADFASIT